MMTTTSTSGLLWWWSRHWLWSFHIKPDTQKIIIIDKNNNPRAQVVELLWNRHWNYPMVDDRIPIPNYWHQYNYLEKTYTEITIRNFLETNEQGLLGDLVTTGDHSLSVPMISFDRSVINEKLRMSLSHIRLNIIFCVMRKSTIFKFSII